MTVPQWLEQRVPAFAQIDEGQRLAILHFALLWSLFEAQVLNKDANAPRIVEACRAWAQRGVLKGDTFDPELAYFRNRYIQSGQTTYHFGHLNLTEAQRVLVDKILRNGGDDIAEVAAAVLVIVYRFRNNLFHGEKWGYQLQDQLENFEHANAALMKAMELHSGP
jgi:hypothetical protein